MNRSTRLLMLVLAGAAVPACGTSDDGAPAVALPEIAVVTLSAGNVLTTYSARAPGVALAALTLTGLTGVPVGMDYRPATGELLVVDDSSRLYSINTSTGAANPVGGAFSTLLSGTAFAVDVNPTADRLRIASNAEQNLRIHPATGAVAAVDTPLAYATGDVNFGVNPDLVAFAYSNNFAGATSTVLFGIDRGLDTLVYSPLPNAGELRTIGPLGVDATQASFDLATDNQGYLAMEVGGMTHLYSINLNTGAATDQGMIGAGSAIVGMTVAVLPAFLPAAGSIVALKGNVLLNYAAGAPGSITGALTLTGVTGTLVGIDYRPATGELLALSDADILYSVNTASGTVTGLGMAPFVPTLTGASFGVDVNPTVDRVRVMSEADENLRLHPVTGATAAVDTGLAFAVGDPNDGANPFVVAAAYTNNTAGAVTTTLYGIDVALDILVILNLPNDGTLNTVGALGVAATDASFEISPAGIAYAALAVGGTTSLYTVNLASGAATLVGTLGTGGAVSGLTVKP